MIYVSSKAVLDRWVNQYQNNVELRKKSKKSNKINDPLIMWILNTSIDSK